MYSAKFYVGHTRLGGWTHHGREVFAAPLMLSTTALNNQKYTVNNITMYNFVYTHMECNLQSCESLE